MVWTCKKKTYNNKKRVKRNNCKLVTSKFTRNETNWSKTNSHTQTTWIVMERNHICVRQTKQKKTKQKHIRKNNKFLAAICDQRREKSPFCVWCSKIRPPLSGQTKTITDNRTHTQSYRQFVVASRMLQ